MRYDVMIIGAGPGGYTAANKAAKNGLSTVLFEKSKVGGTCLNRGCIPMKSLIQSANIYNYKESGKLYGINMDDISFDYSLINNRRDEVVSSLRSGVEKSLKANKVELIEGEAKIIDKDKILCNGEEYEGNNIIIASGSVVAKPPIDGIEYTITSDDVLETDYKLPESMIIIGGGVIGVEIASALSSFGVKITILEMADNLIPTMDSDLGKRLSMFFKKRNIDVICSAAVKKISEDKSVEYIDKNGEAQSVKADEVLIATGRKANLENLFENVELEISRGVVADIDGKTNIDNIYVIGDAMANNIQLDHVAEAQGENIIDFILNR